MDTVKATVLPLPKTFTRYLIIGRYSEGGMWYASVDFQDTAEMAAERGKRYEYVESAILSVELPL